MARVGFLGGSFNPVHIGHLLVAQSALEAGRLDRVLFMPARCPPHKPDDALAPAGDRVAMLRLALAGNPLFDVATDELEREGPSYAIDTVRARVARGGGDTYVFVIGMDSLRELHLWRDVAALLPLCEFLTVARPGVDAPASPEQLRLPPPWGQRLTAGIIEGRRCDVSSSEIRRRIAEGRPIRYLVPSEVERYIAAHGLYS